MRGDLVENLKVFFAVFIVAALLLGCGGQQPAAPAGANNVQGSGTGAGAGANVQGTGASGGAGAGGSGSAGANAGAGASGSASGGGSAGAGASGSAGAAGGAGVSGSASGSGSAGTSGSGSSSGGGGASGSDLAGLGFLELAQLGAPVECNVQLSDTADTHYTGTTNVKMRGKNFRMEADTIDAQTGTSTHIEMIVQEDAQLGYMRLNSDMKVGPFADCEWLKIDMNESQDTQASTTTSTENQLNDLPPGSFTCSAGVFGDDIFTPTGKVCDYAQILADLALPSTDTGGYGG